MNKFIRKLSQREIGFLYILLYIIIGYLYSLFDLNILYKVSIINPIVMILRLGLLIVGILKIFSKEKQTLVNEEKILIIKKVNYAEPLIWIIVGIIIATSIFLVGFFCNESESCKWIMFWFSFIYIPLAIFGIGCVIVGLIKLNKYFKYKKSQQQNIIE